MLRVAVYFLRDFVLWVDRPRGLPFGSDAGFDSDFDSEDFDSVDFDSLDFGPEGFASAPPELAVDFSWAGFASD